MHRAGMAILRLLIKAACSDGTGDLEMLVNVVNPTVSTVSADFVAAAAGAEGWEGQGWQRRITVKCVTLDELIAQYGLPHFTKIDVEGAEAAVLAGLSRPLPALSFEFTTIQRDVALACLDRLKSLGRYRYKIALGESQRFEFLQYCDESAMKRMIETLPHQANSGDVYAVLQND